MEPGKREVFFRKLRAAEKEYIESQIPIPIKEIARRYELNYDSLGRRAIREKWVERGHTSLCNAQLISSQLRMRIPYPLQGRLNRLVRHSWIQAI